MQRITFLSLIFSVFASVAWAHDAVNDIVHIVNAVAANEVATVENNAVANSISVVNLSEVLSDSSTTVIDTDLFLDSIWNVLNLDSIIDNSTSDYAASVLFMPLIFDKYESIPYERLTIAEPTFAPQVSKIDKESIMVFKETWMYRASCQSNRLHAARNYMIINHPDMVKYNLENLPKAPQEYVIVNDPTKQVITIVERPREILSSALESKPVKIKKWKISFSSNVQISQVFVSKNWYQGGNSNLNLLSDQLFTINYNDPTGKLLFENLVQWKFNLLTSAEDTVHKVRVSEDLFQINSKFGYKAFSKWYYSASMLFKTQLLTNYAPNSMVKETEFLSPGELNVGLGLSYSFAYEKPVKLSHTLTLSPLSYNLRFVALPNITPSKFGIESGNTRNEIGSSLDYTMTWDLRYNIRWMTHLYAFTNYKNVLLEWTNSLDFSFSTYFSARLYLDLRYDNSVAPDPTLGYWQIKELLSIGFSYKI